VKTHHGVPKTIATMSILGVFLVHFKMQKFGKKHKKLEMMLKLTSFSMSKLMVPYFEPFLIPLFSIGDENILLDM
jgi:hypothetical protein